MKRAMPANLTDMSDEFWEQQAASEANAAAAFSPSNQSNGTLEIPVGASPSRRAELAQSRLTSGNLQP
jgi:hypothetical protein